MGGTLTPAPARPGPTEQENGHYAARVVRDPKRAAELADIQRVRVILDRLETSIVEEPSLLPPIRTARKWWEVWK